MKLFKVALIAGLAIPFAVQAQDKKAPVKPKVAEKVAPPKEAIDPVCGMTVDPKTAPSADYKGKTYYFCSADEKADFAKSPEKYIKDANKK
jgi:Cu+-exporting ATPase